MSVVDGPTEPRWTMKGNVLPDRDFLHRGTARRGKKQEEKGPRFEKLVKHSQPHCMQYLFFFLFLPFVFSRSRVSLDHYVLFYVPTSCSTYLLQSGTWCRRVDARIIWGTELLIHSTTFYWLLATDYLLSVVDRHILLPAPPPFKTLFLIRYLLAHARS